MKIKKIVLAGLFLLSGLSIASAQVKLSFNPEKGTKYEYRQQMIQNAVAYVMGQDFEMVTEMNLVYQMEIIDKSQEETHVKYTFKEVTYKTTNPMMSMGYDSKNADDKLFGKTIGQSFVLVIAPDGSVKSVTGLEEIAGSISRAIPDGDMLGEQVKQQFSATSMKNAFEQAFKIYPKNAVKAGDKWNSEFVETINGMNTSIKTNYTLKEFAGNVASIAVDSVVEMKASGNMDGKFTGKQTGTILVDTRTGIPASSDMIQKLKGEMNAQGYELEMDMDSKVKTTIK